MAIATMFKKWFGETRRYKDDDGSTRVTGNQFELTYGRSYHKKLERKVGHGFGCYVENGEKLSLVLRLYWFVLIAWSKPRKQLTWEENDNCPKYGFNHMDNSIYFYLGNKSAKSGEHISVRSRTKEMRFPWARSFYKREIMTTGGKWVNSNDNPANAQSWAFPATYTTKYGVVQQLMIEAIMERTCWRLSWFPWLPLFTKRVRSADFKYLGNEGNGIGHDRSGWKGGVIGGSIAMHDNEHTPKDTYDRLVREQHYG